MTMTKVRIIEYIASKTRCSERDAEKTLNAVLDEIKGKLNEGEEVKICDFGRWTVQHKKSRPGRNPYTGEKIEITPRRVFSFHCSARMREAVNSVK